MSLFSKNSTPNITPPTLPDPLPAPPQYASGGARPAGAAAPAFGGTLLTSPINATATAQDTARKSLLGQ